MTSKYIKTSDSSFTKCKNNLKNILLKNNSIESIYIDILENIVFYVKLNINNQIKIFDIPLLKKEKNINEKPSDNKIKTTEYVGSDIESDELLSIVILPSELHIPLIISHLNDNIIKNINVIFSKTNSNLHTNTEMRKYDNIESCTPIIDENISKSGESLNPRF